MSDRPTLYRRLNIPTPENWSWEDNPEAIMVDGPDPFMVVPVELCEHGFHIPHWVVDVDRYGFPAVTVFCDEAKRPTMVVPEERDYGAAAETAKRIFGPDVEWAQHPDPMTDDDWLRLARLIVDAAIGGDDD